MTRVRDLPDATLVRVAHAMGIFRWRSRAELARLVEGWPHDPASTFARVRKTRETTIGKTKYLVTQLGAITGGEFIFRLGMPLLALVASGMQKLDARAIGVIQKGVSPDDFAWAITQLRGQTKVWVVDERGAPDARGEKKAHWFDLEGLYDDHFAGAYGDWLKWLQFALEVNFGDFFGESPAPDPGAKDSSPSSSQPTSDGPPGGSSPTPA